jgi:asparagine synthase (glutamine-hydrolysing)
VIEVAEGIPFAALTQYDVPTLYSLKGEIVRRGVRAITGHDMPAFPKRRFQHGAVPADVLHVRLRAGHGGAAESEYRRQFLALYA